LTRRCINEWVPGDIYQGESGRNCFTEITVSYLRKFRYIFVTHEQLHISRHLDILSGNANLNVEAISW